jgi:hypothetical protein
VFYTTEIYLPLTRDTELGLRPCAPDFRWLAELCIYYKGCYVFSQFSLRIETQPTEDPQPLCLTVTVARMEVSLALLLASLLVFTFLIAIDATSVVLAVSISVRLRHLHL